MNFLLDTNVVSEWVKPRPDPGVIKWLAEVDEDRIFLSVVTLAELRHGVDRMAAGTRRDRLNIWVRDEITARFDRRILAIDLPVAEAWGRLAAHSHAAGQTPAIMDGFLAATAEVHKMTMVTRNVADFSAFGSALFNPWIA